MSPTNQQDPNTWLSSWEPENPEFWESAGKALAWRTLWVTTFSLILCFITWFVVSALVVRLPEVGFELTTSQLFWLAAMPGLAGGNLRVFWAFLPPVVGTRHLVTFSNLLLLIPLLGWAWAVQNVETPFWVLMLLAFLAGVGGGSFSGYMPSTSYFFPRRLVGTALALQAGLGNFGVSVVQFITPWIIGFALLGPLLGDPQTLTRDGVSTLVWLQNALLLYVPFVLLGSLLAWNLLKSVPIRANLAEQFDIFRDKHTWFQTSLYIMTRGSLIGYFATFPLLIKIVYGGFEGAPDPLAFAFLGPLIGSLSQTIAGPFTDRHGGAIWTQISGLGLFFSAIGVTFFLRPDSLADFPWFVTFMLLLFFFAGIGSASTFKQMSMIFEPRKAGGVIGWTAAIAAFGAFVVPVLVGAAIASTGSAVAFFVGAAIFYTPNVALNWYYYARKGAEKPC